MIRALLILVYALLCLNIYFWGYGKGFDHGYLSAMWDVEFNDATPIEYFEELHNDKK